MPLSRTMLSFESGVTAYSAFCDFAGNVVASSEPTWLQHRDPVNGVRRTRDAANPA